MRSLFSSIPKSTYRSWWLKDIEGDAPDAPRLSGSTSADVAIIGGGYVGLWAAVELKLRDPAIDIAVLEASTCGSGASGRN